MPKQKQQQYAHTPKTIMVVPCYNETKRMHPVLFLRFLQNNPDLDFIFVNDGSTDDTDKMLGRLYENMTDRISILHLKVNSGKEEAVRMGLLYAMDQKPDYVGYWDADLASPLSELPAMQALIQSKDEIQCVYGARIKLLGHKVRRTLLRRLVSMCCRVLAQSVLDLPVTDTQCGAKIFRVTRELHETLRAPFTAKWLFDVELFARLKTAWRCGNPGLYEHPLSEWQEISGSNVSMLEMLGAGITMFKLILSMRMGLFHPSRGMLKTEFDVRPARKVPYLKRAA